MLTIDWSHMKRQGFVESVVARRTSPSSYIWEAIEGKKYARKDGQSE